MLAALSLCVASSGVVEAKQPPLPRQAAIQMAKKNLQTLKKPLPKGYQVFVKDGKAYVEMNHTRNLCGCVYGGTWRKAEGYLCG